VYSYLIVNIEVSDPTTYEKYKAMLRRADRWSAADRRVGLQMRKGLPDEAVRRGSGDPPHVGSHVL
jgi:hypothetical protein